ncbi:MAG: ATPase [Micavibrio sp.]|nr:MAG: ATPase [Micavibrio sp.]
MKRFYKLVSTKKEPGGFGICLDSKPVKTPSGTLLLAPTENMANEIVKEWAEQEELIVPDSMPLTQILTTRIDRVSKEREAMSEAAMKYLDTDLLCYHAEQPPDLVKLQQESWAPWLDWFEGKFGMALQTTTSLSALRQEESIHHTVLDHIESATDDEFTALQLVVSLSGSLVLGLAFSEGDVTPEQVFNAAHVEEQHKAAIYHEDLHGPDPMEEKKQEAMKKDLQAAAVFLKFLK